jgi:chromosomal replication initiation ATPase DnaA
MSKYLDATPSSIFDATPSSIFLTLRDIGTIFGGMDYAAVAQRVRRIDRDKTVQRDLKRPLQECQNI